ncbi:MAG TPA: acyl-CoA reductase, partial [Thermoanaerobaculia bacterium]|nr:acyl-CoA reductase [Thermoanaerobaculia bacterium]
ARSARLSPAGLVAGLEAVLGGVAGEGAAGVFAAAAAPSSPRRPVLVVLAGNLPGLAVQPLLPALALRRPVLLESARAEPWFAPAFAAALAEREPVLGGAVAAACWAGGDEALEAPVLAAVDRVLAYGEAETIADLERRAPGKVIAYGPKTSLAALGPRADLAIAAEGLARDVALFDQRGCLSVAAVYVEGAERAERLALLLAAALAERARAWPPGPPDPAVQAAVRQLRDEAAMRGLLVPHLPMAAGTVIVDPAPTFRPTPGLRTVRIHPVGDLAEMPGFLRPWAGRLQGLALSGLDAGAEELLRRELEPLGLSRLALPGELQVPDVRWHNGGIDPLEVLG